MKLTWDRRLRDRRRSTQDVDLNHRRTERRRTPPFTWETADFLVVEKESPGKTTVPQSARQSNPAAPERQTGARRGRKSDS